MKSMTGFGRVDYRDETVEFSIEIKTINHRYRDFFIKIPKSLNPIEEKIKTVIAQKISRGRIEIFMKYTELGTKKRKIVFNRELAKEYIRILNEMRKLDSMIGDDLSLSLIAKFPDVVILEEDQGDYEALFKKIEPILQKTLQEVNASREREGAALREDVFLRTKIIIELIEEIEKQSPNMIQKYREGLKEHISNYIDSIEMDEKRILTEVAIMSDKLNIDEELTRLRSHTKRIVSILEEKEPVGRKLDFLIQELNREINTIGSKASDLEISNRVVDIKCEVEKIREQIQNIE